MPLMEVEPEEPARAEPLLHARAEEEQPHHVEHDVPHAAVQEHVRDDRPRPRERVHRDEHQRVGHAGHRLLDEEHPDVRDQQILHPAGHVHRLEYIVVQLLLIAPVSDLRH